MVDCILTYLGRQVDIIKKSLEPSVNNLAYNDIHDFRVASKKLRYIIDLIDYKKNSYKKLKKLHNKNFKTIVNRLGKIRELQVSLNIFQSFNNENKNYVEFFEDFIKGRIDKNQKRILSFYENVKNLEELYNDFLSSLSSKITKHNKKVEKFFFINLNRLLNNNQYLPSNNHIELHGFRKNLKKIRYAFELISEHNKNLIIDVERKIEIIRNYEVNLGRWHDSFMLLNYLKKCLKIYDDKRYYQLIQLSSITRALSKDIESMQNKVYNEIHNDSKLRSIFLSEIVFF